jgi:hypothetical protein
MTHTVLRSNPRATIRAARAYAAWIACDGTEQQNALGQRLSARARPAVPVAHTAVIGPAGAGKTFGPTFETTADGRTLRLVPVDRPRVVHLRTRVSR